MVRPENCHRTYKTASTNSPKDTKHSKAAIVDLCNQSPSLGFFGPILAESKGIIKVKWDRVGKVILESRKLSWFST